MAHIYGDMETVILKFMDPERAPVQYISIDNTNALLDKLQSYLPMRAKGGIVGGHMVYKLPDTNCGAGMQYMMKIYIGGTTSVNVASIGEAIQKMNNDLGPKAAVFHPDCLDCRIPHYTRWLIRKEYDVLGHFKIDDSHYNNFCHI